MKINLQGLFNPEQVAASLDRLPAMKTTMMDTLFPKRPTHPRSSIAIAELSDYSGTIPLVRRSGATYRLKSGDVSAMMFAPKPLKPEIVVDAAEVNDLRDIFGDKAALNAWTDRKVEQLRQAIRDTTEAMCSVVATTGKLTWPSMVEGGSTETFEMDFGQIGSYTASTKWDAQGADASTVYTVLKGMEEELNKVGYGGEVAFMAGPSAFGQLLSIAGAWQSTAGSPLNVRIDKKTIYVGGYAVMDMSERYKAPNGTWTNKVGAKQLLAYAADAPGAVTYLALDSISAGLKALPFHVHVQPLEDDSGYRLIGNSKPLPVRSSKSLCLSQVIT